LQEVAAALTDDEAAAVIRDAVRRWPAFVGDQADPEFAEIPAEVPAILGWGPHSTAVINQLDWFYDDHDDDLPDCDGLCYAAFALILAGRELTVAALTGLLTRAGLLTPPDLSAGLPPEPAVPAQGSYDEWSLTSMTGYLAALDRYGAWHSAATAAQRQREGAPHLDIMLALAAAEERAPEADRPWHAARLDGYAAAYELRGWYRYTDSRGHHRVQVNRLRGPADGNRGRWYVNTAILTRLRVVDRDTGQYATGPLTRAEADAWITAAEATSPLEQEQEHTDAC
jgi:hypothetical protein